MSNLVLAIIATAAYQQGLSGGHWLVRLDSLPEPATACSRRAA
jgi:hypothetical protein